MMIVLESLDSRGAYQTDDTDAGIDSYALTGSITMVFRGRLDTVLVVQLSVVKQKESDRFCLYQYVDRRYR